MRDHFYRFKLVTRVLNEIIDVISFENMIGFSSEVIKHIIRKQKLNIIIIIIEESFFALKNNFPNSKNAPKETHFNKYFYGMRLGHLKQKRCRSLIQPKLARQTKVT